MMHFTLLRLLQPTFISLRLYSAETFPRCQQDTEAKFLKRGIGSLAQTHDIQMTSTTPACQNITTFVLLWQKLLVTATLGTIDNLIRSLKGPVSPYSNLIWLWSPIKRHSPTFPHPQCPCPHARWRDRHFPWSHCNDLTPPIWRTRGERVLEPGRTAMLSLSLLLTVSLGISYIWLFLCCSSLSHQLCRDHGWKTDRCPDLS